MLHGSNKSNTKLFGMHNSETDVETTAASYSEKTDLTQEKSDVNIVDWDGDDDPDMPLNWTRSRKWAYVIMVASLTLLTPFCSSMFAPGIPLVMSEFHSTNEDLASFVVSVYLLGYAFGPLVIAPLSELYGRLPVYHINTALFILWNVACARSTNLNMLIAFRFLTGLAGACPLTVGAGSIADCFRQEERGKIMAIYILPVLLGPSIGPVAGGYLSQYLGWRWNFYFIIIVTSAVFVVCLIFQRESYAPVILEKRARRLRKETGNTALRSALRSNESPQKLFWTAIIRPTKLLFLSPIVLGLSLLCAIAYGCLYLFFTTVSDLFENEYQISTGNVGLIYLGCGLGQFIGIFIIGAISDRILRSMAQRSEDGEMKPEYRLPPLLPSSVLMPIGLLFYGWAAYAHTPFMVPVLGTVIIGIGAITVFQPVATYLIDAFPMYAASATAANTVFRSVGGALLPLCGRSMYASLGYGWGNTLLACVGLTMVPMVWVFMKYGERIRTHPKWMVKLD